MSKRITIEEALRRSNLDEDGKKRMAQFIPGVVAGGGYPTITEALVNEELRCTDNDILQKALSWAVYGALFYPGQFIPFHRFLSCAMGRPCKEFDDMVTIYRRNDGKKIRKRVTQLGVRSVEYVTQEMRASDPSTVSGFRVTFSPEDYMRNVVKRSERIAATKLKNFSAAVADNRIRITDLSDEILKNELKKSQELSLQIQKSNIIGKLLPSPASVAHLLGAKRKKTGT